MFLKPPQGSAPHPEFSELELLGQGSRTISSIQGKSSVSNTVNICLTFTADNNSNGAIFKKNVTVKNDQDSHIVGVEESEDFFAIGDVVFSERPLWILDVKQDQQLKLKCHISAIKLIIDFVLIIIMSGTELRIISFHKEQIMQPTYQLWTHRS